MSAQRAGEENIRTLEAGVGRGWGRVLNLLKAGEELGLLTGLKERLWCPGAGP